MMKIDPELLNIVTGRKAEYIDHVIRGQKYRFLKNIMMGRKLKKKLTIVEKRVEMDRLLR